MYPPEHNPPAPAPTRNRRPVLILVLAGVLALLAVGGTLFATGALSGSEQGELDDEDDTSARARPDEPSVNPDDTRYDVVAELCADLDLSEFEAMIPAKDELEETFTKDPYGVEASRVECSQYLEDDSGDELAYATVTVGMTSYASVVEARLSGYGDYASLNLDELTETEPRWVDGDWEKAQLAEGIATADAETVLVGQDDNLAFLVTLSGSNGALDSKATTEAVLATAAAVLELCEK